MIETTFHGNPVYLLPYGPSDATKQAATFSLLTTEQQSNDAREARGAQSEALRVRLEFSLTLHGAQAVEFRIALQRLKKKRVLCPFWPAVQTETDTAFPVATGLWLTYEPDLSAWWVHDGTLPGGAAPSADACRVPLLIGFFEKPPTPSAQDKDFFSGPIAFVQAGSAAYALRTTTAADGVDGPALPTMVVPKIFSLPANWRNAPEAGSATVQITREQIGYGLEPAEIFYDQPSARPLQFLFTQKDWSETARLLKFFHARQGTVESFWLPGAYDECQLALPAVAGTDHLHVDRAETLGDNRNLALLRPDDTAEIARVVEIQGNDLRLAAPLAATHTPGACRIVSAILARFKKPELKLEFSGAGIAEGTLSFIETPAEYNAIAGEIPGVTFGARPRSATLFRFSQTLPDTTIVNRFTSYERPVVLASEVFEAVEKNFFTHGEITDSLEMERAEVKLTSRLFEDNPLRLFMPFRLEVTLWLEIIQCDVDVDGNGTNAVVKWYGPVAKPQLTGPKVEATVSHRLKSLNTQIPAAIIGPPCSKKVYSSKCGLSAAAWTFSGVLAAYDAEQATLTINNLAREGGTLPSAFVGGFFAQGRVYAGAGAAYFSRSLFDSSVWGGDSLTLQMNLPLDTAVVIGSTVYFQPGCNHTPEKCTAFANYGNYGGHRFVPNGNPALVPVKKTEGGGKK